jgi:hypothetical protein
MLCVRVCACVRVIRVRMGMLCRQP